MSVEKTVQVKVPGFSGFDKSHRVSTTLKCGTITPLVVDELIPGSRVNLRLNVAAQLKPLVSDTYMNVKLKAEAFFCPSRILCKSFESFYTDFPQSVIAPDESPNRMNVAGRVPVIMISRGSSAISDPNGLLEYCGFRSNGITQYAGGDYISINALPLLAYHLIWQEWYRNPRVQAPAFQVLAFNGVGSDVLGAAPHIFFYDADKVSVGNFPVFMDYRLLQSNVERLADGHSLFELRQRLFPLDMYTSAQLRAQQGDEVRVAIQYPESTASFTISALRSLNSIQQFRERNNIPSPRMQDQTRARYGVDMSDGVAQRPLCLGSAEYDVYSKGIDQTAAIPDSPTPNPFNTVGAQYGRAYASGSDFIIDDFTANEPGYLFVMVTLVPSVSYSFGVSPLLTRYVKDGSITDMANPILQNVGPEVIDNREIAVLANPDALSVTFGYRERYGAWKDMPSVVHGLLKDGQNLESFVLQRSISTGSSLGSDFLEIPIDYMDQVFAASEDITGFDAWLDSMISYKVSMPLAKYSIPSLQDPAYEYGRSVSLRKNGQIF